MAKRVLIADDHRVLRGLIKSLLANYDDVEVCGEASDGVDAVEMARRLEPDVMVLDLSLPRMNGFAVAAAVLKEQPNLRVILFSEYRDAISDEQLRAAGISVCLSKSDGLERLAEEVRKP